MERLQNALWTFVIVILMILVAIAFVYFIMSTVALLCIFGVVVLIAWIINYFGVRS